MLLTACFASQLFSPGEYSRHMDAASQEDCWRAACLQLGAADPHPFPCRHRERDRPRSSARTPEPEPIRRLQQQMEEGQRDHFRWAWQPEVNTELQSDAAGIGGRAVLP